MTPPPDTTHHPGRKQRGRNPREVELKFQLPKGSRAVLEAYPPLAGAVAHHHHLVSTYFDTPNRALDRCGLTLRVRRDGAIRTQTVKSRPDGNGVAVNRGEWEWPIEQDSPDVTRLEKTEPLAAAALAIEGQLQPAFVTDVLRTTRLLSLAGDTTVEVAFDEGRIDAGAAHEAISELELELKGGSVGPLYQLAASLQSLAPLWLLSDSKAARGWHLRTGESEGAQLRQAPKLKRKISGAAGFQQLLGGALGHLTANIGPTMRGDPEGLHQARIAIRETRALLRLFDPFLDKTSTLQFTMKLRHFAQVLGDARDWDVFCLETLPAAKPELPSDRLVSLNAAAETERHLAHEAVVSALQGREFSQLILALMVWSNSEAFDSSRGHGGAMHHRLSILAPSLLHRAAARVRGRGRHVGRLSVEGRHCLRKALKKLSFNVDDLAHFFGAKGAKRYRRRCEALEKILGLANDAVVTDRLTLKLVAAGRPELSKSAHILKRWSHLRRQRSLKGLSDAMKDFRDVSVFW